MFYVQDRSHVAASHSGNTSPSSLSAEAVESVVSVETRTRAVEAIARIAQAQLSTKTFRLLPSRPICLRWPYKLPPISNGMRPHKCESYRASGRHAKDQSLIVKFALVFGIKGSCRVRRPVERRRSSNLKLDHIHLQPAMDAPLFCAPHVKYAAGMRTPLA